ncbi:endonuclease/exonuclease/phosphatase family protein [Streptomyces purpurogeneiscleroticus]|uniref:endonuclease/exonuclease/phosphatase family protein n=1 Tax=Streptomyces purpurogeneiscleroticus TaxID=68259 RepID=UPI001CBDD9E2|nr:endonuclease/exonuclease/phosphatase family protein [Streptomyces purpurogeneiscleroticus]MBZ4015462.1 endonuclease/exonuclease/phosphatase [Streptomyces purpurogeneiscleroticus]
MPSRRTFSRPLTLASAAAAALAAGLLAVPQSAAAADARIHDIQGGTRISPLAGKQVTGVPGVVTAVRSFGSARGFWFQDPQPDRDPATSEAVFVFTGKQTPEVAVGDAVEVSGTVTEYYPGGKDAGLQSVTEITGAKWTVNSAKNRLPAAFTLDPASVPNRYAPDNGGKDIEPLKLRPGSYALDRYESLEGMRVAVSDAPVVGATNTHHELWVTAEPGHNRTVRGGTLYSSYADPNAGRLKVTSLIPFAERPFPVADVGDALTGTTAGPLDYDNFGGYTIEATDLGTLADRGPARETTRKQSADELSVATYNVENLSPKTAQAKFDRLAEALVKNLVAPDIVALEEVQDDNGATNDSVVTAGATLKKLTDAVKKAGGPAYEWRQIDPADDQDGGQPGGNIRVAFLHNPERVSFTDTPGGDATTPVKVEKKDGRPALSASPGRIDPANAAWKDSRKPLAGQFSFRGKPVFVVANHFNSKGGDQGLDSRFQPPARTSETQRTAQAEAVHGFVEGVLAVDPKAAVIVAGDLNDYQFSPALKKLTAGGVLTDQVNRLPKPERYGYVYNGNSQALDHMLTSRALNGADYDIVHLNAEFADQASDHDPQVLRVRP